MSQALDDDEDLDDEELNDPGNEDPGSLMDDAEVPLNDLDDAADVGNTETEHLG
ncbi:hypothetical protein JFT85_01375 [Pseudomonas sp. TH04]|uniref:hypothetical protein n=1 Tax=Pseudomonas sp. TH04 TaxID=2796370 RepID=UPI0015D69A4D|nr:hypothetical protein [Pseudomonas sp. TH04]MBK5543416.1 hypothetical protein [Pseudomonas sp. TH04]